MSTISDRLAQHLDRSTEMRFVWQRAGCCQFVAAWVERERGTKPLLGFSFRSAVRRMHEVGAEFAISEVLGCDPISATAAQVGDPVLMDLARAGRWAIGICVARQYAAFMTNAGGFAYLPMARCRLSWPLAKVRV